MGFGKGALLWLIGIPLPIIIILALLCTTSFYAPLSRRVSIRPAALFLLLDHGANFGAQGVEAQTVSSACPCPARETHFGVWRARRIQLRKVFLDRDGARAQFPLAFAPLMCGNTTSDTMQIDPTIRLQNRNCRRGRPRRAPRRTRVPGRRRRGPAEPLHRLRRQGSFLHARAARFPTRAFQIHDVLESAGQVKLDGRAMTLLAVDTKMTASSATSEPVDHRQPQARAFTDRLCRKERIDRFGHNLGLHARTRV